ncbi:NAD(P)/FAD-dependent oxidoreductase [Oryzifoliimicrobium ureilyticus]|uniref:NAD(P)/FAD-dependent oxidoreductase n=1 Tax=Oryzifoliimicrobium ureilyticus TaxID=3113724 RepID=UPI0030763BA8
MFIAKDWQSPIAPGLSWYQESSGERPAFPALEGSLDCDVAIIGGGYTGLQAAYHLAEAGTRVALIEAQRVGDGASGRNGGQLGTGQRWWPEELEEKIGYERSKALFDLAEGAKRHLLDFAAEQKIDIDFVQGHLNVSHKKSYEAAFRANAEIAASRYSYPHMRFLDKAETDSILGSTRYHCGVYDSGTGHIHPLKLLIGLARSASVAGASIFEMTAAKSIDRQRGKVVIDTAKGQLTADRALIACNGYIGNLEPVTASHVMPIRSFIGATVPLDRFPEIIPGGESVADSRFVVRYFRKTKDGRLLFGGREAYTADNPRDISHHIRRQIAELYPQLKDIEMTHAWGGSVGITMPRQPFVRDVMPGVTSIGGYSGHGVMLANYCGRLYAQSVLGTSPDIELFKSLDIPAFPGGARMRRPLLFLALSWFALRDRF